MLNVFLALVLTVALCLVVCGVIALIAWIGWNILLVLMFIVIFAGCYDFVDHMRNG